MKPHLSITQLAMLARCPKSYEFRYVFGLRCPPGVSLVVGKGTHKSVEAHMRAKMAGETMPAEAAAAAAADATREEWKSEPPALSDEEKAKGEAKVQGEAVDTAVALATLHHAEVAPGIEPIAVEQGFRLELDGYPVDLVGFKDVETATEIRDTKTAAKSPAEDEAETSPQGTLYCLESHLRGEQKPFALDFLVKLKKPKAVTLRASRTVEDYARFLRRVEVVCAMLEAGVFPPADPTHWCCSPKWCGYWDRCEHGRGAVSVAIIDASRLRAKPWERK